jgi:hypothetical protein
MYKARRFTECSMLSRGHWVGNYKGLRMTLYDLGWKYCRYCEGWLEPHDFKGKTERVCKHCNHHVASKSKSRGGSSARVKKEMLGIIKRY